MPILLRQKYHLECIKIVAFLVLFESVASTRNESLLPTITSEEVPFNCTSKFCGDAINCTAFQSCKCGYSEGTMLCEDLYQEPFLVQFIEIKKLLLLSAKLITNPELPKIVKYFKPSLAQLEIRALTLVAGCFNESYALHNFKFDETDALISEEDIPYSELDFTWFGKISSLKKLNLVFNCLTKLNGTVSASFPKLTELDLSNNLLKNLSENVFHGLFQLQELNLFLNRLQEVHQVWFKDMKSLKNLQLSSNNLTFLPEGLFNDLPNLETLGLSGNFFKIPESLFFQCQKLKSVSFNPGHLQYIPENLFANSTELEFLMITDCSIKTLPDNMLHNLKNIQSIYLFNNKIEDIPRDFFKGRNPKLSQVELGGNQIRDLNLMQLNNYKQPVSFSLSNNKLKNLYLPLSKIWKGYVKLDLSNNCFDGMNISHLPIHNHESSFIEFKCSNCCLTDLVPELAMDVTDSLVLSNNYIVALDFRTLTKLSHLKLIDISSNLIDFIDFPQINETAELSKVEAKTRVDLNWNYLACDCRNWPFIETLLHNVEDGLFTFQEFLFDVNNLMCWSPEGLKGKAIRSLQDNDILCPKTEECPEKCSCVYVPGKNSTVILGTAKNLTIFPERIALNTRLAILLSDNKITFLPSRNSSIWEKLQYVNLTGNHIVSLANFTIGSNLLQADLQNNKLKQYEPELKTLISSGIALKLSGNPWQCCCEIVEMKNQIFNTFTVIDRNEMSCWDSTNNETVMFRNLTETKYCIASDSNLIVTVFLSVSFALITCFLILGILSWYYRREIRLWLFLHSCFHQYLPDEVTETDKKYDAFVCYSSEDDEWVANVLVAGLENDKYKYKLCIHNRDWLIGAWIPEQICNSIKSSSRTIIVLTDNFLKSNWSLMEFEMAYQYAIKVNVKRLIVIVPKDVPALKDMDRNLKAFMKLNTYIKYDDPLFWEKLVNAMSHVKVSERNL